MFLNVNEQRMYKKQIDEFEKDFLSDDELKYFIEENERFLKEFKSKMDANEREDKGEDEGMKKYVIRVDGHNEGEIGFTEMMEEFSIWVSSDCYENVLVIDAERKKVICAYNREGKMTFNRSLLDGAVYFNDRTDEDEMLF